MRKIIHRTSLGNMEIEVADALVEHIAKRNGIPADAVSDGLILEFFREASDVAMRKAADEYIDSDGTSS